MPTPEHERSLPVHVEIPELPEAMQQWFDFVHRAEDGELMLCRWRERWIDLLYVVDGLSAAHVLGAYRYAVTDGEWVDLVGDEPGDWRREWIAIASEDGVPFIADISQPGVPVYFAREISASEVDLVHDGIAEFIDTIEVIPMRELMPDGE